MLNFGRVCISYGHISVIYHMDFRNLQSFKEAFKPEPAWNFQDMPAEGRWVPACQNSPGKPIQRVNVESRMHGVRPLVLVFGWFESWKRCNKRSDTLVSWQLMEHKLFFGWCFLLKIGILIAKLAVADAFNMAGRSPRFLVKTIMLGWYLKI